jgi:hypothetical protein
MDVEMDVMSHEIIGTYICALTKSPDSCRPETVEDLMMDIARYINDDCRTGKHRNGRVDVIEPFMAGRSRNSEDDDVAQADFVEHDCADKDKPDALGTWQVAPFVFFRNVKRDAKLTLVQHSAENVMLRLPEPNLLMEAEKEASTLARLGDPEKFQLPPHYYRYFSAGDPITSMEVLTSNIGYYVTASCR